MIAIFKREFTSLFHNVIGWLFVGITLALFGFYFFVYNLSYGYPYVAYTLTSISFAFLITVPILTMRVFSEERKNKTDQLILTAPVSVIKIVLGKFLAVAAAFSICTAVICVAPIVLRINGKVPLLETYVGILGFYLYGLTCIAIGVFVSSLTENPVISAIISFLLLFAGYMMSGVTSALVQSENIVTKILNCYDLVGGFDKFSQGIFSITGLIYYVSVIALCLFLTSQVILKRRWSVSSKKISFSVFSSAIVVIGIAAVIVLNVLAAQIPEKVANIDVTNQKIYSITSKTKNYLKKLDSDVTIYVLSPKKSADETLNRTLELYKSGSKHIKVKYIDTSKNPDFASKYSDSDLDTNSMIVVSDTRNKVINYSDVYDYDVDYTTYTQSKSGYDGEGQLTSAILYVTSEDMPVIYELEGHNEVAISGDFEDAVAKSNISMESLNLLGVDAIPDDCEALIINGPETDFSEDDVNKVLSYMQNGGKVFISLDYRYMSDLTNFKKILQAYGLNTVDGIVADTNDSYYYQQPFYLLPEVESSMITYELTGTMSVFVPYAVGITYPEDDDNTYTSLMVTSDKAISKVNYKEAETYDKEDGDISGPFHLGVMVETKDGGTIYCIGSTFMFGDETNAMVSGRNAQLFSNIIGNSVNTEGTSNLVIPVKDYTVANITVSQKVKLIYGIIWGILVPMASIIAGIVIWAKRRKK